MLEQLFDDPQVIARRRGTVLGATIDELTSYLLDRGNRRTTIQDYARAVEHFAHWLKQNSTPLRSVTDRTCKIFVTEHLPICRCRAPGSRCSMRTNRAALRHLMYILRATGQIPPEPQEQQTSIDMTVTVFEAHLTTTCGLAATTCRSYVRNVRDFLEFHYDDGEVVLSELKPEEIAEFIAFRATQYGAGTVKMIITSLRSFLRFATFQGLCRPDLAGAVPTVPHWRQAGLPSTLSEDAVKALLDSFDGTTTAGLRDRAMVLCLLRLGLRAGEVAALRIDDFDWRQATVCIRGKERRVKLLPLPAEVGEAIVAYLQHIRPTRCRHLFVRYTFPVGAPLTGNAVGFAVRRAFGRSGVHAATRSTHILRYTAATQMLRGGASLKEIADILGHRNLNTTAIYAKVDVPTLAEVAMSWPEERS